jgi:polysaccharide export outer membrane protein
LTEDFEDQSNNMMRQATPSDLIGGWRSHAHTRFQKGKTVSAKSMKYGGLSVLAIVLATACGGPPATMTPEQATSAASSNVNEINKSLSVLAAAQSGNSANYRIGPDDLLQVTNYNIPEQDQRVTPRVVLVSVSQEGSIDVPLIGTVEAKGKTPGQLEQDLKQRYKKYIRDPQVGVLVTEYRQRVSVMGAVQKPGVFDLTGPKNVIDMIAQAGGITEKAGNQVQLYRQDAEGKRQNAIIDLLVLANPGANNVDSKDMQIINMPVEAGDVINVPQAGMYFVDGAVHKPGSYPIGRNYTLTQALAAAGGVDPELADYGSVSIYRRLGPTNVQTIGIDLDDVLARKTPDLQVQPDDVIIVPMSSAKYFVKRFVGTLFSGTSAPAFR